MVVPLAYGLHVHAKEPRLSLVFELGDCFITQGYPRCRELLPRVDEFIPHFFHILLDDVFVSPDRPTLWMATNCELSTEYLLWNAIVWHAHDMTNPS